MIEENTYFEGGVKSLAFSQDGAKSSVGVMSVGEYTFGTGAAEKMTVVKGALTVKLPGSDDWQTFCDGQSFDVPGNASFDLQVAVATAYLCEYL